MCIQKQNNNNKNQNYQHLGELCAMRSSWQGGPIPLCGCNDLMLITWSPSSPPYSASSFAELMMQSNTGVADELKHKAPWSSKDSKWPCYVLVQFCVSFTALYKKLVIPCLLPPPQTLWEQSEKEVKKKDPQLAILYEEQPNQFETRPMIGRK